MSTSQKSQNGLLPPINPLTKNSGSATGNPRNKCALKPGHSLMDWIRLGNSGCDLSGTNGIIRPISVEELNKHCTQDDAWMALYGNVYNITRYMEFHPGGPEELMRGVGRDATKLFNDIHAWVNYEQLLKKCLIGPLQNVVKVDLGFLKPSKGNTLLPSKITAKIDATQTEIIPRFDWIQKSSELILYFYTKQFCNPGFILTKKKDNQLNVQIFIDNKCHLFELDLHKEIIWPPNIAKVSNESGKIELNFSKSETDIWPNYGTRNVSKVQQIEDYRYEFEIKMTEKFNHNSFAMVLHGKNEDIFSLPVGYHLTFCCPIEGKEVCRSYTPIAGMYSPFENVSCMDLHFLLKIYDDGILAKHISCLKTGSTLEVSQPKGNLQLSRFLSHTKIAFIAAGSGITPILGLIDALLSRNSCRVEKLVLMFFNRTEEDIWCKTILDNVSKNDNRFSIIHILSQPKDEWNGEKGHINTDLISVLRDHKSPHYSTFVCVCGPSVFNTLAETICSSLGFTSTNMHFFSG